MAGKGDWELNDMSFASRLVPRASSSQYLTRRFRFVFHQVGRTLRQSRKRVIYLFISYQLPLMSTSRAKLDGMEYVLNICLIF